MDGGRGQRKESCNNFQKLQTIKVFINDKHYRELEQNQMKTAIWKCPGLENSIMSLQSENTQYRQKPRAHTFSPYNLICRHQMDMQKALDDATKAWDNKNSPHRICLHIWKTNQAPALPACSDCCLRQVIVWDVSIYVAGHKLSMLREREESAREAGRGRREKVRLVY